MAEGFITRRGGVGAAERTLNPSINFVSKTENQIVVTFTNAEANEVDIFYGITSTLTDKVTVAASGTSSNVTFSGLDPNTPYTISAYAIVTDATLKKIKSEIISTSITTDQVIYTEATGGTTAEYNESGKKYKSHTFNSSGNFVVSQVGNGDRNQVDYLVIAGGAGAGGGIGGGGGAGGYRTTNGTSGGNSSAESKVTVTATTFGITIGGGGAGGANGNGVSGSNTSALGITSTGGGFGGRTTNAGNGGSGGGTRGISGATNGNGIAGQGFRGGTTNQSAPGTGGGGASQTGTDITANTPSKGGDGLANLIRTGSNETRAGGGGGGGGGGTSPGAGGAGGGGAGSVTTAAGGSGAANTGGGGGGGAFASNAERPGGPGGSGIVIIRYEIAPSA